MMYVYVHSSGLCLHATYCKVLDVCGQPHYVVVTIGGCATVAGLFKPDKVGKLRNHWHVAKFVT
jgi:hypothetical protein